MRARPVDGDLAQVELRAMTARRRLVIGAGPCGLACGWKLRQLGDEDWVILESSDRVGGLARSVIDA
jgi:cation diffusion facilitator CzcD-associated flavoprotein CzcO